MENTKNMTPDELKAFKKAQKEEKEANKIPNLFQIIWIEIKKSKFALGSLIMMLLLLIIPTIISVYLNQREIMQIVLGRQNFSPAQWGPLGTDSGGRPMFEMLILATRNSLWISFGVTIGSLLIGYIVGLLAGFYGGFFDLIIMRVIDILIMIPFIMVIMVISSMLTNYNIPEFMMLLILFGWFSTAISFRARVLQESSRDYVLASKTLGTPNIVIMFKKVLPNVTSFIMVGVVLGLAFNIGIETGLTFLGFGLPAGTPSIGHMIALARDPDVLRLRPWQWLPAVMLIITMTMSIRGVGNAVSRAVNPKQRR